MLFCCISSAVTAPSSPKYSSGGEFDLTELDQLEIRSRNNSNGRFVIDYF